ncbi:4-oxalocrotonate tautomerase family protein [Undibacterium sp.]|uniref:tautomerase family protein n=1 Tax=Undibacterium sp. TaxID=1914977 RepID=UPI00374CB29A
MQHLFPLFNRRSNQMPYVNIKVTNEGVTAEQKLELIQGVTNLLTRVLNKKPSSTFVVIDEVEMENWGVGLENVLMLRAREAAEAAAESEALKGKQ